MTIQIGTSGYSFDSWRGIFYPSYLVREHWLMFYACYFKVVEINVTFYQLLPPVVFRNMADRTPDGFGFIVKAHRTTTHDGRDIEVVDRFRQAIRPLNKLLAKMASKMHKPHGLTHIQPEQVSEFLENLPIAHLWGVGEKTASRLNALGIATVSDLRRFSLSALKRHFGKAGQILSDMARGQDTSPVIPYAELPEEKSMGHERTFREDTDDRRLLEGTLLELSDKVARRLRQNSACGRVVVLKLRYST